MHGVYHVISLLEEGQCEEQEETGAENNIGEKEDTPRSTENLVGNMIEKISRAKYPRAGIGKSQQEHDEVKNNPPLRN